MSYASFIAAAWKMYSLPPDWSYGMVTLRHVLGVALIALHIWTVVSIHESLGEFGWFFGDFFFDQGGQPKLTYGGIYRYLNNPERVLGLAGVWGITIITWSKAVFFLALLSHILTLAFIQLVERPHMQRLYGQSLRQDSGLERSLKRSLPKSVQHWQGSLDRVIEHVTEAIEHFIEGVKPTVTSNIDTFVKDTKATLKRYPARVSISRRAAPTDLSNYDPRDYSLEIEGTPAPSVAERDRRSGREGENARQPVEQRGQFRTLMFEYGTPVKVKWTVPANHGKKDWIGLYMVSDNASREVTRVSSQGRWIATTPNVYDETRADEGILVADQPISSSSSKKDGDGDGDVDADAEDGKHYVSGEMQFSGDKLWWTTGVFELRYHHDAKHNVMAVSLPFEVRIGRFDDQVSSDEESSSAAAGGGGMRAEVEKALLPVVRNCFDRDPEIAPETVEEGYGALVEREGKYARRVVFAVHQMFGIEFAPEVVQADGNVKNLAWRICNAKKVLAPYSMNPDRDAGGRTTPTGSKD
ncbi:phosphatidylethanolamine N-methyltransferase [Coniosporium uncinatum]|uniref:Phosphatidylethanolamine N-methyltransferase n=1 Tax=Coniosporium uncinatum TaxID=93489 RepID=A0ACC3DR31_9PEZI|nr:phosphatidylethanolamine N-methyltransferase [Coniosporium uncinatum]